MLAIGHSKVPPSLGTWSAAVRCSPLRRMSRHRDKDELPDHRPPSAARARYTMEVAGRTFAFSGFARELTLFRAISIFLPICFRDERPSVSSVAPGRAGAHTVERCQMAAWIFFSCYYAE